MCKSYVKRNTEALIESSESAVARDPGGSLAAIDITPGEACQGLQRLGELIATRRPENSEALGEMQRRYLGAAPTAKGETAILAFRLRLFLDRWNLWPRLTRYRTWQGPNDESLDGTNSGSERAIGW